MPTDPFGGALNAAIKYNPHLWGADELRAVFVVRQAELERIVAAVRDAPLKEVPQHMLVCGHRGMGKSTLLRRIALAVRDDPELSRRWLPLNFPEEQYTVRSLAEFLLNVLDVLADTLEQAGASPEELEHLDRRIAEISVMPLEQAEAAALNYLDGWVKEHERGLILLVDSSDMLLESFSRDDGKAGERGDASALWRLRRVLSHQPGLFWIGASYRALESQHQYEDAFHDFFALHELRPLDIGEMRLALIALARRFGVGRGLQGEAAAREMAHILDSKPERLKTLRLLSGGNPRTMVTLYELFAAGGEDSIHADLTRLLDVMTPLYKARMEALSDQARKILSHVMENWHPVGVRELEAQSGIAGTTVSGQLNRLEAEGLVEKAALAGKAKRAGYQVAERFFNVWYLMRYGTRRLRQRLTWAVQFMRMWFSRDELASLAAARARRHVGGEINDGGNLEFSRAVAAALGDDDLHGQMLDWSVLSASHRETCRTRKAIRDILPEVLFDLDGADRGFKSAKDYLERFAALDEKLGASPLVLATEREDWINDVKASVRLSLDDKEFVASALQLPDFSRVRFDELRKLLADERQELIAAYGDGVSEVYAAVRAGEFFPDCPSSDLAFRQMHLHFGSSPAAYCVALKLTMTRHCDEWVEKGIRHCIELDGMDSELWGGFGALLKNHLKRYDEAEAAYRRAIALDEHCVAAWNDLGNLLQEHLERYDEAEAAYRQAIALDERNAIPWNNLGNLLKNHLKRYDEAEAAFQRAIALDERYAAPWNNLGNLLKDHLKRYDEAEAAYRRAAVLDEGNVAPWNGLGDVLQDHLKRYDEAEAAYREGIRLDPQNSYPLANLARLHAQQGKGGLADEGYRACLKLTKDSDEQLRLQANLWLGNRDLAMQALNELAAAACAGDENAFFRLREQCCECSAIGRAAALAELMEASTWADFLLPFRLALDAVETGELPGGVAPEMASLAQEVLQEIRSRT